MVDISTGRNHAPIPLEHFAPSREPANRTIYKKERPGFCGGLVPVLDCANGSQQEDKEEGVEIEENCQQEGDGDEGASQKEEHP